MSEANRPTSAGEQDKPLPADQLLPLVYQELRRLAAQKLAHEQPGQTLQTTALVHEAYLRLVDVDNAPHWNSRGHFFAAAAEAMRRILIENARRKKAEKHGGDRVRIDLADAELPMPATPEQMLLLDDAIESLTREDAEAAEIAKLRLFAGVTVDQAAEILNISRATAFRHWSYARAWLQAQLSDDHHS